MTLLEQVRAVAGANPCSKLSSLSEVMNRVYSQQPSSKQDEISSVLDIVFQKLEGANMTYEAGEAPPPEIVKKDCEKWMNQSTLLDNLPILWIVVNGIEIVNVMFTTFDLSKGVYVFTDHFTLTNTPPHSSPQYSKGEWVFYCSQNHISDPERLLNYVPLRYKGHNILVHLEKNPD
jgi:hypothetical protein